MGGPGSGRKKGSSKKDKIFKGGLANSQSNFSYAKRIYAARTAALNAARRKGV